LVKALVAIRLRAIARITSEKRRLLQASSSDIAAEKLKRSRLSSTDPATEGTIIRIIGSCCVFARM
jgi:hypothetical protein